MAAAWLQRWNRLPLAGAAALAAYTAASLAFLRPIWRVFADHISPNTGDPLFNLYVLKWSAHQIREGLPDLWNANFFFPTRGVLALSDHLLGPALQLAAFTLAVPNAIAGYNALFFTSFVLSGLATYYVLRRSGAGFVAALLAGAMFAFSPFRLSHANHLQVLLAQWIPLTLWFWDRLLARRRPGDAALFLLFYLLNLSGGAYFAYMIHFPLLVLFANRLAGEGWRLVRPRALAVLVPVGLVAAGAALALYLPYVRISDRLGLVRGDYEIEAFGATLASYVSPAPQSVYVPPRPPRSQPPEWARPFTRIESSLFAGVLPTLLAVYGFVTTVWRRHRSPPPAALSTWRRAVLGGLLALAAVGWALGDLKTLQLVRLERWSVPALLVAVPFGLWLWLRRRWAGGWPLRFGGMEVWERGVLLVGAVSFLLTHPVVYLPLMRVVPGLSGMRVSARFYVFVSFAVAWLAARGIDRLLAAVSTPRQRLLAAGALAALLAVDLAPRALPWVRLPREEEFPAVYQWIAEHDEVEATLELPLRPNDRETFSMYYSTLHWKPVVNGFSGYQPRTYAELTARMSVLPDRETLDWLRELGVTHLVVHRRLLDRKRPRALGRWEQAFGQGPERRVALVHEAGGLRVYALVSPGAPAGRSAAAGGSREGSSGSATRR